MDLYLHLLHYRTMEAEVYRRFAKAKQKKSLDHVDWPKITCLFDFE